MHPIPNSRLILGPPGCGKTYTLIEIVREALARGVHPSRIAFVSFTTKAIREALDRACAEFNLEPKQLPNFRTLHATGYHALGLQRTDVMARADYKALGDMLGVEFNGADRTSVDDGIVLPTIGGSGAKYIQSVMRARYREVSLAREYNEAEDYSLSYQKLVQVHEQNEEYKTKMGKQDFVDMIALYPVMADPIHLDLLIVDEAQDLTPLQWTMVRHMAETAAEVVIAGDDDQAIHRWAGVDVRQFLRCSENIEVLSQSYRLPRSVWRLAKSITARIEDRIPKDFHPKDEEGSVQTVMRLGDAAHGPRIVDHHGADQLLLPRHRRQARADGVLLQRQGGAVCWRQAAAEHEHMEDPVTGWHGGAAVCTGFVRRCPEDGRGRARSARCNQAP
jgi:DNA helicase II / ATP-dependent DNA helicase PcrA